MNNTRTLLPILSWFLFIPFLNSQTGLQIQWDQDDIICKEQELGSFKIYERNHRNAFSGQTDIYYQTMEWEIDPAVYYIKGVITYFFKSKIKGLTELHLDLSKSHQIHYIVRGMDTMSYTHTSDQLLTIDLNKTLASGESDTLTISYEGVPPSNGFGSFEQGAHAGKPIIWTLSEPYGARDWWPCKQDLTDKIDSVDIFITTPIGQLAASNGKLISMTEVDGKLVHHWQHRYPIASYLVALAVTNYASYSHFLPLANGDSIEILNYVYPETLTQTQQATLSSLDIMGLFNELVGTYPFAKEKYGHAQFGWGGGMEHQTMSFMGSFGFGLQAHEMAHQWFGNKVTCGSWTEIWLNEGFATYLTGLTYERFSPNEFWLQWKTSTSNSVMSQAGGSVFVDDTTSVNRIFNGRLTYNKGAYVLHMLRWVVGDSAFFHACRDYLDLPGTSHDFGYTSELQAYMEQRSGIDLDEFFVDWYYGQGYPSYDLRWTQKSDSLIMWLDQRQSHTSVSFFEMPVPVKVSLNGMDTTFVLPHDQQGQRFAFDIGNTNVESIKIDPDLWILSKNNTITEFTTSVYHPIAQGKFAVYPNPVQDIIHIYPSGEIQSVDILDMYGRNQSIQMTTNEIAIHNYAPGYYVLMLRNHLKEIMSIQSIIITK